MKKLYGGCVLLYWRAEFHLLNSDYNIIFWARLRHCILETIISAMYLTRKPAVVLDFPIRI